MSRPQSAYTTEGMNKNGQNNMDDVLRDMSETEYQSQISKVDESMRP